MSVFRAWPLWLRSFGVAIVLFCLSGCGDTSNLYNVSIPDTKVSADNSITAFEIHIEAGSIEGYSGMPIGWDATVNNDVGWKSTMKAAATTSESSFSPDELKRLVVVVRKGEGPGTKFNLFATLTLARNGSAPEKLALSRSDLVVKGAD